MAQYEPRGATEAESTLHKYLGLDFPTGTEFITIRQSWGQHRLTAWVFRWPEGASLPPRRPLPLCELCLEGYGRPVVMRLSRSDFGLERQEMRRIGGLLAVIPVRYGPDGWIGLPRSSPWVEAVLTALQTAFRDLDDRRTVPAQTSAQDYASWLDAYGAAAARGGDDAQLRADLSTDLLLAQSGYFDRPVQTDVTDGWRWARWLPARHALAVVKPVTCVVIGRDAKALVDLLERRDGELVALVSNECWLWRTVYGAGAAYVPVGEAASDAPAWVANSDAVLRAPEIPDGWCDDALVPVAARSAANFVARMMVQGFPPPWLIDTCHIVDTTERVVTFRLLPVYAPWMEADLTASVDRYGTHREPLRPVLALHAGWSGMADWATEFLERRAGPQRRELVDGLLREGI